jgi:uncharacterized membrane protein YozB (DUF420 family)
MSTGDLPLLNALLNTTSAILVITGYRLVRAGRREAHRRVMLLAIATSFLFLVSYLAYHAQVGSVRFTGRGLIRAVYLTILASHTVLAAAILPLVLVTATRALRGRFDAHRRLARYAFPLWLYVSVSGVVVYVMLYRM